MKTSFKKELRPRNGHWWARVDKVGEVETWASVGTVGKMDLKTALDCYKLSLFYYAAGILQTITAPLIRCDSERVIGVIDGDGVIKEP